MKNIKIVSQGSGAKTKVYDADTGEQLKNVTKVTWTCEAGGLATCTMEMVKVQVEVNGTMKAKPSFVKKFKNYVLGKWTKV